MVGNILQSEREKQGLTIKDVENETSIRALYIESIEKGNQKALPSEVYVKGFIRNYAEFLHLDADALVQQYREEIHGTDNTPVTAGEKTVEEEHKPFSSGSDFRERVQKSHRTQNILVTIGVVIVAFVGSIYYFFGEENAPKEKPNSAVPPASRQETPAGRNGTAQGKEPAPSAASDRTSPLPGTGGAAPVGTASAAAGKVDVTARFTGRCWVQALADGKVVYEGTAEPAQTLSWKGSDRVVVTVGNAGAVEIVYNGRNLGKLGKVGDVVEKHFTRDRVEDVK